MGGPGLGPVSGGSGRPWARGRRALAANFDDFVPAGRWEHWCFVSTQNDSEEEIREVSPCLGARPAWGRVLPGGASCLGARGTWSQSCGRAPPACLSR